MTVNPLHAVVAKHKRRQPSRAAKQRVRDAFNADKLAAICTSQDFSGYAPRFDLQGKDRFYHYKDNGSTVLAVAHLDSVQRDSSCTVTDTAAGLLACSGALDDRLGAYVILELLPQLGITCDWLLTTDEEMGRSTAAELWTEKDYNWIIQFDRAGTDVVMYQYETPDLAGLVEDAGGRVGTGSYSDIVDLDHLGCAAFNWGVGYEDYHSARSHAWLEDTFRMVARFAKFHKTNAKTFLPHNDPFSVTESDDIVGELFEDYSYAIGEARRTLDAESVVREFVDAGYDAVDIVGLLMDELGHTITTQASNLITEMVARCERVSDDDGSEHA